ncbi:MAG: hypothetical protein IJ828_01700 [Treponema sp.]|nr:hypothetical protein [Treponema sp.]
MYTAHGIRLDVYVDDGKKVYDVGRIVKIGVNYSSAARQLTEWMII